MRPPRSRARSNSGATLRLTRVSALMRLLISTTPANRPAMSAACWLCCPVSVVPSKRTTPLFTPIVTLPSPSILAKIPRSRPAIWSSGLASGIGLPFAARGAVSGNVCGEFCAEAVDARSRILSTAPAILRKLKPQPSSPRYLLRNATGNKGKAVMASRKAR